MLNRLPVAAATEVLEKYGLDQVLLIARDGDTTHYVTDGKTKKDKDMAAVDGEKLRRVVHGSPTSYEDALALADTVRELLKEDDV